jgi:hypothetical protein
MASKFFIIGSLQGKMNIFFFHLLAKYESQCFYRPKIRTSLNIHKFRTHFTNALVQYESVLSAGNGSLNHTKKS